MRNGQVPEPREKPGRATAGKEAPECVPSEAILGKRGEVVIEHGGSRYVLRVTRQGRLILNKWSGSDDER
jgi:hemin uptake protein HemP